MFSYTRTMSNPITTFRTQRKKSCHGKIFKHNYTLEKHRILKLWRFRGHEQRIHSMNSLLVGYIKCICLNWKRRQRVEYEGSKIDRLQNLKSIPRKTKRHSMKGMPTLSVINGKNFSFQIVFCRMMPMLLSKSFFQNKGEILDLWV